MFKYEIIDNVNSAESFLNALHPSKWTNPDGWESDWMFRGHGDDTWELKPTVHRWDLNGNPDVNNETQILLHKMMVGNRDAVAEIIDYHNSLAEKHQWQSLTTEENKNWQSISSLLFAEYQLLTEFSVLLDQVGRTTWGYLEEERGDHKYGAYFLNLHDASDHIHLLRHKESRHSWGDFANWREKIAGAAQHHRLPTRLLDWTKNSSIAAYFAGEGTVTTSKYISVFALRIEPNEMNRIKIVNITSDVSDFIQAQQGVFTIDRLADRYFIENGMFPTLNQKVTGFKHMDETVENDYTLKEFRLPVSEVPELMRLLWLQGITRAHLMPNLDNVAEALKTKWKFM